MLVGVPVVWAHKVPAPAICKNFLASPAGHGLRFAALTEPCRKGVVGAWPAVKPPSLRSLASLGLDRLRRLRSWAALGET